MKSIFLVAATAIAGISAAGHTATADACTTYCTDMASTCPDEGFPSDCKARCVLFPKGEAGATANNSAACRQYHVGVAATVTGTDKVDHCHHASTGGANGVCGTSCEAYCFSYEETCKDKAGGYFSLAHCVAECAAFPLLAVKPTKEYATGGNSLECREYHATVASGSEALADIHCRHAGPTGESSAGDSAAVCGDRCDLYCDGIAKTCDTVTGYTKYADKAACRAACSKFAAGEKGTADTPTSTGDSLACRMYHLTVSTGSSANANTHCPHAQEKPTDFCVAAAGATAFVPVTCNTFCQELIKTCADGNAQYGDINDCMATCKLMPLGFDGDTAGNTLNCREYHRGVAAGSADNAKTHCPHAGPTGENSATDTTPVCGDRCDVYCDGMLATCAGTYADKAACRTACGKFMPGKRGTTSGDTLACRMYHLEVSGKSADDAKTHCPHAQEAPTDFCTVDFGSAPRAVSGSILTAILALVVTMCM